MKNSIKSLHSAQHFTPERICFWNTLKGRRVVTNIGASSPLFCLLPFIRFFSVRLLNENVNEPNGIDRSLSVLNDH